MKDVVKAVVSLFIFLTFSPSTCADYQVMGVSQDDGRLIWSATTAQAQAQPHWDMLIMPPPVPLTVILQKAEAKIRSSYGEDNWILSRIRVNRFGPDKWAYIVTYVRGSVDEKAARSRKMQFLAVLLPDGTVIDPIAE